MSLEQDLKRALERAHPVADDDLAPLIEDALDAMLTPGGVAARESSIPTDEGGYPLGDVRDDGPAQP